MYIYIYIYINPHTCQLTSIQFRFVQKGEAIVMGQQDGTSAQSREGGGRGGGHEAARKRSDKWKDGQGVGVWRGKRGNKCDSAVEWEGMTGKDIQKL